MAVQEASTTQNDCQPRGTQPEPTAAAAAARGRSLQAGGVSDSWIGDVGGL